jgi:hypothetical protein
MHYTVTTKHQHDPFTARIIREHSGGNCESVAMCHCVCWIGGVCCHCGTKGGGTWAPAVDPEQREKWLRFWHRTSPTCP